MLFDGGFLGYQTPKGFNMKKKTYGFYSILFGIIAGIITLLDIIILFIIPPATYVFERFHVVSYIPLTMSAFGLLFYYLQKKMFVSHASTRALILNGIVFLVNTYLIYNLYMAI